jgi:AraC-like DNA-binding protein
MVARAHNVSERTLQRALEHDGTSYSRELVIARMNNAARFLARSATVAAAWARSGYGSHAHFTRTFKRHFGISPESFRRIAALERRMARRDWKDLKTPVRPGSADYFRTRKWRSKDVRELQRLAGGLSPNARAAVRKYAGRRRLVIQERLFR